MSYFAKHVTNAALNDIFDFERAINIYSLTTQSCWCAFYTFAVILVCMCFLTHLFYGVKKQSKNKADKKSIDGDNEKKALRKLSWVLSCFNSGLLTALGCIYTYYKLRDTGMVLDYKTLHNQDNFSFLVCIWFAMFNATDLIFGGIFYLQQMGFMTACIHHPLFIYIMIACTTGCYGIWWSKGGLVATLVPPFAPSFMLMTVEELPTFILALGSVFPSCRSDMGFGITFFLLRIVYHGYVLVRGIHVGVHPFVSSLFAITGVMHIFWFRGWVVSQLWPKDKKPTLKSKDL